MGKGKEVVEKKEGLTDWKYENKPHGYWTKKRVKEVLIEAWENIATNDDMVLMEDVAHSVGITKWSLVNVMRKFPFEKELQALYEKIDEQILRNVIQKTASKEYSVALMIFLLKNRYGWSDRQKVEHKGAVAHIGLSDNQFQRILNEEIEELDEGDKKEIRKKIPQKEDPNQKEGE